MTSKRLLAVGTLLASLVSAAALATRQWADERFVLYLPEALAGSNPMRLARQALITETGPQLNIGVFRPLSRLGFYIEYWFTVRISSLTGIPPHRILGLVKVAMLTCLIWILIRVVDQYRNAAQGEATTNRWRNVQMVVVVVFAASLIISTPPTHPLTLFPLLYLGTTTLALWTVLRFGSLTLRSGRSSPIGWVLTAIWGMCLASMIELAALAVPLAWIHATLINRVRVGSLRESIKALPRTAAFAGLISLTLGFVAVFVPTRIIIAENCASGSCYLAASTSFGPGFFRTFPFRLATGFFPLTYLREAGSAYSALRRPTALIALVAGITAWFVIRQVARSSQVSATTSGSSADVLARSGLGWFASMTILAGATMSSLSEGMQGAPLPVQMWREQGYTMIGWSLIAGLLIASSAARLPLLWARTLLASLAIGVFLSGLANFGDIYRHDLGMEGPLLIQAGEEFARFDPNAESRRCDIIERLSDLATDEKSAAVFNKFTTNINAASLSLNGREFCPLQLD